MRQRPGRLQVISEKAHTGVPSWFRATCHEASRGGSNNYQYAGMQLGRRVGNEIPHALDYNEWDQEVDTLRGHCEKVDTKGIIEWLVEFYPAMMQLVPSRRREALAAGIIDAYEETEGLPVE